MEDFPERVGFRRHGTLSLSGETSSNRRNPTAMVVPTGCRRSHRGSQQLQALGVAIDHAAAG